MAAAAAEPKTAEAPPPKRKLPITLIAVVGVAVLEAAGFMVAFQFMGGHTPPPTYGQEGQHAIEGGHAEAESAAAAEVMLLKSFRVPNNKSGRTFIYDFDISIVIPAAKREEIEATVKERNGELADAAARIIRAADQRILNEDDFRILRNQLQEAFARVLADEHLIERILIPRCVPLRLD